MSFLIPDSIERPIKVLSSREFWVRAGVLTLGVAMLAFALAKLLGPQIAGATKYVTNVVSKVKP